MNKLIILTTVIAIVTGCGKLHSTQTKEVLVPTTVYQPTPVTPVDEVQAVVDEENAYRLKVGTLPLAQGLTCSLYTNLSNALVAFPTSLPSATATYVYKGVFDQPDVSASLGLNILPPSLRSLYLSWFAVRCTGQIVITESDYYRFDLTSDDASLLYLDNVLLVDNNGNHGATLKSGTKMLRRGVHAFRLDYMQGPAGNQALMLYSGSSPVSASLFYR